MRSRHAVAGAVAAALVLAGCSTSPANDAEPAGTPTGPPGPTQQDDAGGTSAGSGAEPEGDSADVTPMGTDQELLRTPQIDQDPLPVLDAEGTRLPYHLQGRVLVEGPWDVLPQERNGTFLAPQERDGALDFTAVDSQGSVLWMAQRPASCAGFAVTSAGEGSDLAVLTDLTTTQGSLAQTTATAYDLHTGDQVWGPVEVGGPHIGPGLVFSAPGDAPLGAMGARLVLDGATGNVVAREVDDGVHILSGAGADDVDGQVEAQYDGADILGEYEGTVLLADGDEVVAIDADQGRQQWRLADHGWDIDALAPAAGARPGGPLARLQVAPGTQVVVDVDDGSVLAGNVTDVGTDPSTGTHVVLEADHARAYDSEGEELWAYLLTGPTTITGIGGVMVYLRTGDSVRVHNVLTGEVAQAYPPDEQGQILVPAAISADGGSVVAAEDHYRLVTVTSDGTLEE